MRSATCSIATSARLQSCQARTCGSAAIAADRAAELRAAERAAARLTEIPTLSAKTAIAAFYLAAKSFNHVPILSLCGLHKCRKNMLHGHIHVVGNSGDWLCLALHKYFHVNGRLRSEQELREYEPPSRGQKNSASVWRATGFYPWDFFAKAKGLRRSISRRRPLKGWEGGQCCAMVASYGVWMPKLKELLKEGVATIDDAEAWS